MWQKFKKSVGRSPTPRSWYPKEMKIIGLCFNNNIFVSTMPDWENNAIRWFIDIKINKKTHRDPKTYEDEEVLDKIYEYYKYYYDKYNKQQSL